MLLVPTRMGYMVVAIWVEGISYDDIGYSNPYNKDLALGALGNQEPLITKGPEPPIQGSEANQELSIYV